MYVEVRGTGPALVLIHGWAMHAGLFAPLAQRLEAHFELHLVDLPGHGRSPRREGSLSLSDCVAEITARVPRALWAGWSLGGLVALQAGQTQPTAVRGLAMFCASPCFVRRDDWAQGMPPEIFAGFARDLDVDYRATLDRFLLLEAQGSDRMREEIRLLREQLYVRGEPASFALHDGLRLLNDTDLRAAVPALPMPSLWLAGRRDRLVSPQAMQAAAATSTLGRFVQVDGGGHAPFLTHADEVATAMLAFARECPP